MMSGLSSWWSLVVFGVLLHVVFLASVFDIYFKSPSHAPSYVGPARRLVVFVADGLRADSFFSARAEAPFLKSQVATRDGVWGVAHTAVPTESRPGHVALLAGMFEDPSAITKGWQENPADFDTVFNQSRLTWGWGSPDIVPMFTQGVSEGRMQMETYSPEFEDFSADDLSKLDTWVFDRVEEFFKRARDLDAPDQKLRLQLRQDKIVLFLHLLGCDTNGHRNKPRSREYFHNIAVVDAGIRRMTELVDSYWSHDGRTAYIFTADHGMTDWGSHGAGMDHETQVPIVAWGAGIKTRDTRDDSGDVSLPEDWDPVLHNIPRADLMQVDLAPLMTSLLGVGVPRHSSGDLPLKYLDMHDSHKAEAALMVAKQRYEQLRVLRRKFEAPALSKMFHKEFHLLKERDFLKRLDKIERHVQVGKYGESLRLIHELNSLTSKGIEHYQRYYRIPLFVSISVAYLAFMVLLALRIVKDYTYMGSSKAGLSVKFTIISHACTVVLMVLLGIFVFFGQSAPLHYGIYYLTPVVVTNLAFRVGFSLDVSLSSLVHSLGGWKHILKTCLILMLILESLVLAFFDRRFLSIAIALVTLMQCHQSKSCSWKLCAVWAFLNLLLATFAFQPLIGRDEINTREVCLLQLLDSQLSSQREITGKNSFFALTYLVACLLLAGFCVWLSSGDAGPQILSWTIFLSGIPVCLIFAGTRLFPKLLLLSMSLEASYILLSLSYEGIFLLVLMLTLLTWLKMEHNESFSHQELQDIQFDRNGSNQRHRNVVDSKDLFRAFMFLHFSVVSFFGTGNIASLNSFDPRSITCMVSVFNPFLMGGLLLTKVVIPFLAVGLFVVAVRHVVRMHPRALFLLLLLFSDMMSLQFFFCVTDQGSWQEIGTSLSHFVIAEATSIFLLLFYLLSGWLLSFKWRRSTSPEEEQPHIVLANLG